MRLILAVCLALVCGEAMGSISVNAIGRGVSSRIYGPPELLDFTGTDDPLPAPPISSFVSDGVSEASASLSAVYSGSSLDFTTSLQAIGGESTASISLYFYAPADTPLTLTFSNGQSGYANLITQNSDYIWTPTDDASTTIQLEASWYLLEAYWLVTDSQETFTPSFTFSTVDNSDQN
jgi:hypothetical protein